LAIIRSLRRAAATLGIVTDAVVTEAVVTDAVVTDAVVTEGVVTAVSRDAEHAFSKPLRPGITLLAGLGVEGDAHLGVTVQHRSRVARDPSQPNLRQVHLIHAELYAQLRAAGFEVRPGELGENVTTRGVDLLGLPTSTRLHLGADAVVELTGLRDPCWQIDAFQPGVLKQVLGRDAEGKVVRKAGVMAIVLVAGDVQPGDVVVVELPAHPWRRLDPV
jgi:MOSC domain-containing protein YiiM